MPIGIKDLLETKDMPTQMGCEAHRDNFPKRDTAAVGTQVGGSIIRPAGYCGNIALKPTQGGINRGERQATSMSTHGVHAGCIEDMWQVAIEIARRAGGDRGCAGLFGPPIPPAAVQPTRLIVLETEGWTVLDDLSQAGFAQLLER